MDISIIHQKGRGNRFLLTRHAAQECAEDMISGQDLIEAFSSAEIIEEYPEDPRGPGCLVLGHNKTGKPIHAVLGTLDADLLTVVTAYRPDLQPFRWSEDYRKRRGSSRT